MQIEFHPGAAGFREATQLRRILRFYRDSHHAHGDIVTFIDAVLNMADTHIERNEFAALREAAKGHQDPDHPQQTHGILQRMLGVFWKPSPLEVALSAQRAEAIDRAERAEAISFDAMTERANANDEKEAALTRIEALNKELGEARAKLRDPG